MARTRPVPFLEGHFERQLALGRSATQVEIIGAADGGPHLSLVAGPRTVLFGPTGPGHDRVPWQLVPAGDLDCALKILHAQVLEDAQQLPGLLQSCAHNDPEADAPKAVRRRLQRMLALRSVLELAAEWDDAPGPGAAPGWTGRPNRHLAVLPWHHGSQRADEGWHLHQLRRWHRPQPVGVSWTQETADRMTRAALLQDLDHAECGPLSVHRPERLRQRASLGSAFARPGGPAGTDVDPVAFVRRVRTALCSLLDPALSGFPAQDVLAAVQGARSGAVALSRLLPGVSVGPLRALAEQLRTDLQKWGHLGPGEGGRSAQVAGTCPVRRSAWTAARAGEVAPLHCLTAEAAAGSLHLLVPGLQHAGPGSPALLDGQLSLALEEVTDLFTAVSALPADQTLPLPDLSELLTGRGHLRLGLHAPVDRLQETAAGRAGPNDDWERCQRQALLLVPGLSEAVAALQAVQAAREQNLLEARREVCRASGLSEGELEEATGGERPFTRAPGDAALERTLKWSGGVWSVVVAHHPQDLVSDGRTLSHCVGWGGYAQSVRAGHTRIVRVLTCGPEDGLPVPLLTLELGPAGGDGEKEGAEPSLPSWQLVQARGTHNRTPTRDEALLLGLWAREVGVQLESGGEVAPLSTAAARTGAERLAVHWAKVPDHEEPAPAPTPDALQAAAGLLAARVAARWTPAATRTHHEGLRRVAQLVERARQHLTSELLRLHAAGEVLLVGPLSGDDLLPGIGPLTLALDARPTVQALTETGSARGVGLRFEQRLSLEIGADLYARERRQTLDLRSGKRPGELALHFVTGGQAPVITSLSPAALLNTGLLDPLHQGGWTWGVARRRQAGLTLLWSWLDEPLGDLEGAVSAATRQPGTTLRAQLTAWTETASAQRSLTHQQNRAEAVKGTQVR